LWFRDLLRELDKKYEVLLIYLFLLFLILHLLWQILLSNAAISLGNAFISLEISSQFVTKQLFSFNFLFSLIFLIIL